VTAKPKRATRANPKTRPPQMLPPWKVLLHNDDKNSRDFVVDSIIELIRGAEDLKAPHATEVDSAASRIDQLAPDSAGALATLGNKTQRRRAPSPTSRTHR